MRRIACFLIQTEIMFSKLYCFIFVPGQRIHVDYRLVIATCCVLMLLQDFSNIEEVDCGHRRSNSFDIIFSGHRALLYYLHCRILKRILNPIELRRINTKAVQLSSALGRYYAVQDAYFFVMDSYHVRRPVEFLVT